MIKIISEEDWFMRVCHMINVDLVFALKMANSNLRSKKYFKDLLERGLEAANASDIELWLKYLLPRLGLRYIIHVLSERLVDKAHQVDKAMYWLPSLLTNDRDIELFKKFQVTYLRQYILWNLKQTQNKEKLDDYS